MAINSTSYKKEGYSYSQDTVRYSKRNSAPEIKVTRVTEYTGISPNSSTTISITTIGKRLIQRLKESKGY